MLEKLIGDLKQKYKGIRYSNLLKDREWWFTISPESFNTTLYLMLIDKSSANIRILKIKTTEDIQMHQLAEMFSDVSTTVITTNIWQSSLYVLMVLKILPKVIVGDYSHLYLPVGLSQTRSLWLRLYHGSTS